LLGNFMLGRLEVQNSRLLLKHLTTLQMTKAGSDSQLAINDLARILLGVEEQIGCV
ncbi:Hypothetical protein FKW44_005170, partial [Caligus rogercresseyi]